jgi:hypothetical protein
MIDKSYFINPFAIITAWNPQNQLLTKDENDCLNRKLEIELINSRYVLKKTVGGLDNHFEDSFIVYDILKKDAIAIGLKYNQYSIFFNDTKFLEYIDCISQDIILQKVL